MKRTPSNILTIALLALAVAATTVRADERVQNGGFETGSFSPWTLTDPNPPPPFAGVGSDGAFAHSGTHYAFLGSSPMSGMLTQTFNTVAGAMYQISFWLANDGTPNPGGGSVNSFVATFNGTMIASLSNAAPQGYTQYTANLMATGTTSTIQFTFRNDDDFFRLDDVSVNGPAPVPDQGSTLWFALPVFGALVLSHRFGKKLRTVTA